MELKVKVLRKPEVSELAGEKVMIDFESGKYFMLKGAANDIWDLLIDGITAQAITDSLLKEYDIDAKTCKDSVNEFLDVLFEKGFISLA
ncbi:MAG: PqqD family peptide modification chaperone [Mobilitalea sp.]